MGVVREKPPLSAKKSSKRRKNYLPAMFMTMVTGCFLFVAEKEGLGSFIPRWLGYTIGAAITFALTLLFYVWKRRRGGKEASDEE